MNSPDPDPPDINSIAETNRRHLLRLLGAGGVSGLAGCSSIRDILGSDVLGTDSLPSPVRVNRNAPETSSARRFREVNASVEENIESQFGRGTFNYEPLQIESSNSTDQGAEFGMLKAAPGEDKSGDRMWITEGDLELSNIEILLRATLRIEEQIRISTDVLDTKIRFTGSQNPHGIFGLVSIHQDKNAVLVVRARDRDTANSLVRGFNESAVVPRE